MRITDRKKNLNCAGGVSCHGGIIGLVLLILSVVGCGPKEPTPIPSGKSTNDLAIQKILEDIAVWDASVWTEESVARSLNERIDDFWRQLRSGQYEPLGSRALPTFESISWPLLKMESDSGHPWSVLVDAADEQGEPVAFSFNEFKEWVAGKERSGWSLPWSEWRLSGFLKIPESDNMFRGTLDVRLHLENAIPSGESPWKRVQLTFQLISTWFYDNDTRNWQCRNIHVDQIIGLGSEVDPWFEEILERRVPALESTGFIDPLIIRDLNRDDLPDIILGTRNLLYLNNSEGNKIAFTPNSLHGFFEVPFVHAMLADMTRDGVPDFVGLKRDGLYIAPGLPDGGISSELQVAWKPESVIYNPLGWTAGDIDGDGDLDLWIGQYKIPFNRGQMPTPFHDANDGFPSYLLENIGQLQFREKAVVALDKKNARRNYSAVLVDYDFDSDLDLITLNDFAGVDIYRNDGGWQFEDITDEAVDNRHLFAMGHAINDYNNDMRTDLFAVGMRSPIATRIADNQTFPDSVPNFKQHLVDVNYGNRLYFGSPALTQPMNSHTPLAQAVADSGWSWGIASPDVNLDGFSDMYLTTGHVTRQSSVDYDRFFWTRDLFLASSREDAALHDYFTAQAREVVQRSQSYGGYYANRFFLNRDGTDAMEMSWIAGLEMTEDSRNVAFTDIDNDGDHDIVALSMNVWPEKYQAVHVFQNNFPKPGDGENMPRNGWIGFDIKYEGGYAVPFGMAVRISSGDFRTVRHLIASDSYRVQPDPVIRMGTGTNPNNFNISFTTPQGKSFAFDNLEPGKVHQIRIKR